MVQIASPGRGSSKSELYRELYAALAGWGLLDLDSPCRARFDAVDAEGLEALVELLLSRSDLGRCADPR